MSKRGTSKIPSLKSIGQVLFGSVATQAFAFLAAPILTRIYSPVDFGGYSLFLSFVAIFSILVTLRLDLAATFSQTKSSRISLITTALVAACIFCFFGQIFLLATTFLYPTFVANNTTTLLLIPSGIFAAALAQTLSQTVIQDRNFKVLGVARATQGLTAPVSQMLFGYIGILNQGLQAGQLLSVCSTVFIYQNYLPQLAKIRRRLRISRLWTIIRKNKHYATYSLAEGLTNTASSWLPVMLLGFYADPFTTGSFMFAQRIVQTPLGIISGAVGSVYMSEAAQRAKERNLSRYTTVTLKQLLAIGIIPAAILYSFAPFIWTLVFGDQWNYSGQIASWMSVWILFQFCASPVSTALVAIGEQRNSFIAQTLFLIARVGSFGFGWIYANTEAAIKLFCWTSAGCYFIYTIWLLSRIRLNDFQGKRDE